MHANYLWRKAKDKYSLISVHKKILMFQNQNIIDEVDIEKKIEDYDEDDDVFDDNAGSTKWYLVEKDGTFNKVWDFLVTLCIIFTLFAIPVLMIFPDQYQYCHVNEERVEFWTEKCSLQDTEYSNSLRQIIYAVDIIFFIDILLNFFTKSKNMNDENAMEKIAKNYILGYFLFDVAAVIPNLFSGE